MRNKEHLAAKSRARTHLEELAKTSADIPELSKLFKAGFNEALDRLIIFMDDDSCPIRSDAAIAVFQLVKSEDLSKTAKLAKLERMNE